MIFLNLVTLLTAIEVTTGRHFSLSRAATIAAALAMVMIGYFVLVHKGKYRKIAKEFSSETQAQRRRRLVASVIYVALTFVSFFWLVSIRNS